jgi:predicted TIM-barrel fold metal-dependent hydrolase
MEPRTTTSSFATISRSTDVSAAAGLRAGLDEVAAVDQHAHLLSDPVQEWSLAELLSESREPAQRAETRHHPVYRRALRDLSQILGTEPDEDAIATARREAGFVAHARRLLSASLLQAILVDDGFPVRYVLSLDAQADLAGCAVRRVVRIEAVAEAAGSGGAGFGQMRERFRVGLSEAIEAGAVALKTIAAYRCGLDLPPPDAGQAESAHRAWSAAGAGRLTHPALIAFFLSEALDVARARPVPLQVHTGIGDADLDLHRADPSLLGPLLAQAAAVRVPVVLLHCYPFVRQAAWLAAVHSHVYLDLSLTLLLAAHRGPDVVLEALELAPVTKLLFATDASRAPEMFFLAARWWRDALAGALSRLVAGGALEQAAALDWGRMVLAGNARRLYDLA